jgi:hypothetical protein
MSVLIVTLKMSNHLYRIIRIGGQWKDSYSRGCLSGVGTIMSRHWSAIITILGQHAAIEYLAISDV